VSPSNKRSRLVENGGRNKEDENLANNHSQGDKDILRIKLRWSDSVFRLSLQGPITWDRMLDVLKTTPGVTSPFIVM